MIEHGEVKTVCTGHINKLLASGITYAGALHLDYVGTEPGQQLRAGRDLTERA